MGAVTSAESEVRLMLGVAIFVIAILVAIAPFFFSGGNYKVGMFVSGMVVFILELGVLLQ